uniref:EF-hand domain-containing protein n=1 Tax=Oryza rufipogon TaxID=4529 RepID=A0A0E0P7W1_ORYRU
MYGQASASPFPGVFGNTNSSRHAFASVSLDDDFKHMESNTQDASGDDIVDGKEKGKAPALAGYEREWLRRIFLRFKLDVDGSLTKLELAALLCMLRLRLAWVIVPDFTKAQQLRLH